MAILTSLPTSRRSLLIAGGTAFGAIGLGAIGSASGLANSVRLPDFRRRGDIDDTAALQRAAETGRVIHAPAGHYQVAMTAQESLPPTFRLVGDGADRTIMARSYARPAPFVLHADSRSPRIADNHSGYLLRGLRLEDDVARLGFSEFDYLAMFNGVSDLTVEDVEFRGFRGDGLHLGSSTIRSQERHNVGVRVRNCRFDGVNANTRNAISVLDCDRLVIEKCSFYNVGRTGGPEPANAMNPLTGVQTPGAIDIEPEATGFSRVSNVIMRENFFTGGGGFAVTLNLFENQPNSFVRDIVIADNRVADRAGGFSARGVIARIAHEVTLAGNTVERCQKPFLFDGITKLRLTNNDFTQCAQPGELGYIQGNIAVSLEENTFERIGFEQGFALWIRKSDGLVMRGNTFRDCGLANGSGGIAIAFVEGISRNVTLIENLVEDRIGRTTEATTVFQGAAVDRATLTSRGNHTLGGIRRGPTDLF